MRLRRPLSCRSLDDRHRTVSRSVADAVPTLFVPPMPDHAGPSTNSIVAAAVESPLIEFARSALLRLDAEFSPYLLIGSSSCGLSRWLDEIVRGVRRDDRPAVVQSLGGKDFARAVGRATTTDSLPEFRDRTDRCDLLVLDSPEPLSDESASGRELAGLLDRAAADRRPIVVVLPRLPLPQNGWSAPLSGRLMSGLSVPFVAPPRRLRESILRHELGLRIDLIDAERLRCWLDEPCGTLSEWDSAVRGLIEKMAESEPLPRSLIESLRRSSEPTGQVDPAPVIRTVAKEADVRVGDLKGTSRRRSIVLARSVAIWLVRSLQGASLESIGRLVGHRDHTTVLHACRKIDQQRGKDPEVDELIRKVCDSLSIVPPSPRTTEGRT